MKTIETDVAIIGSGPSGMAAAIAAVEKNCQVIIMEKASTTGGTGNMATGPFAVESRLQKEKEVPLTKRKAFEIHMDYTHWRADARLVKVYMDKSSDTISWLENMGVKFFDVVGHAGAYCTHHCIQAPEGGTGLNVGSLMMKVMTDMSKKKGVDIHLRTKADKILRQDNRVAGVLAEQDSGEVIKVNARAVIIGTGGFSGNPQMIKKYTGHEIGKDLFPIKINHKTEVLDKHFDVIRGLYAVGTDANTINGESYVSILPGSTLGFALNSGRIAGENASKYIGSAVC